MSRAACIAGVLALIHIVLGVALASSPYDYDTQHHNLTRRYDPDDFADDQLWGNAICKGRKFTAAFKATDRQAGVIFGSPANPPTARSQWQGDLIADMEKWGWEETYADDYWECDYEARGYSASYDALGLNKWPKYKGWPRVPQTVPGDNICYFHEHGAPPEPIEQQKYVVDGKEYQKTGAHHRVSVNQVGGVLTTQDRVSPLHAARSNWGREPLKEELPALRASADLLWGVWFRGNDNLKNINYFWALGVINQQTSSIVARALLMKGKGLEPWPGTEWSMEEDEGLALLGSPNAISFAYFLISHKLELGNKMITKVRVFWENTGHGEKDPEVRKYHISIHRPLFFYVEDVPANTNNPALANATVEGGIREP